GRVGRGVEQLQRVGAGEVVVGDQGGGEVIPQRVPQPVEVAGALPHQGLVRAGDHLDRLRLGAVPGHRAQLVTVGPHHVRQDVRVTRVALPPRDTVALPVAGHLQRVDRVDLVAGGDEGLYPRAAVGLDGDHHLCGPVALAEMLADHRVQPGDARDAFGQLRLGQPAAGGVLQLHVVVVLGPVVAYEQQTLSSYP